MPLRIDYTETRLAGLSLAKVGNLSRDEPLETSRTLCRVADADADLLTSCFLKSFKSLDPHRLHHHRELTGNELFASAFAIFDDKTTLLEQGARIARHLAARSNHPNIRSGDLCIALIDKVKIGDQYHQALSIVKSESKVPFLQVTSVDGDLKLTTQQGINPDKIDKGCLIINHSRSEGFVVYLFDKTGGSTHFWTNEFVGATPVESDEYLTKRYSELCVAFAEKGLPADALQEERIEVASKAIGYLNNAEQFDIDEFQEIALADPGRIERFEAFKDAYEEEKGRVFKDRFAVSKPEAKKAKRRLKSHLKLDVGVDLKFSSKCIDRADTLVERGYAQAKGMHYIKIFYNKEL